MGGEEGKRGKGGGGKERKSVFPKCQLWLYWSFACGALPYNLLLEKRKALWDFPVKTKILFPELVMRFEQGAFLEGF